MRSSADASGLGGCLFHRLPETGLPERAVMHTGRDAQEDFADQIKREPAERQADAKRAPARQPRARRTPLLFRWPQHFSQAGGADHAVFMFGDAFAAIEIARTPGTAPRLRAWRGSGTGAGGDSSCGGFLLAPVLPQQQQADARRAARPPPRCRIKCPATTAFRSGRNPAWPLMYSHCVPSRCSAGVKKTIMK